MTPALEAPVAPELNDPMGLNSAGNFGPFQDAHDLLQNLEGMDRSDAENKVLSYVSDPQGQESVRKAMEMLFEHGLNDQGQLEVASQLWDFLPDALKASPEDVASIEGEYVNNQGQQTMANLEDIKKLVEASNEEIKSMAQKTSSKNKSYNFKKEAQHKTNENVILWGPESTRIDPFTGEPISDWHVFERNRGWGFRIGDRWDIDFEAFWRGNIMDKYHRPYRDEDGNWVGGYIEKRFEVDRWQPEENTYMLKPGETRKPRPAELGNMEARLEAYRGNEKKVYNWTKANSKKTVKTAMYPDALMMGELAEIADEIIDHYGSEVKAVAMSSGNDTEFTNKFKDKIENALAASLLHKEPSNIQVTGRLIYHKLVTDPLSRNRRTASGQVLPPLDSDKYPNKPGLEGPFRRRSGKVLYYDAKEGKYYDPESDMYISDEDLQWHDSARTASTKTASGMEEHIAGKLMGIFNQIKEAQQWLKNSTIAEMAVDQYYKSLPEQAQRFLGDTPEKAKDLLSQTLEDAMDAAGVAPDPKQQLDDLNIFASDKKKDNSLKAVEPFRRSKEASRLSSNT